jgi:hypothetical protein
VIRRLRPTRGSPCRRVIVRCSTAASRYAWRRGRPVTPVG